MNEVFEFLRNSGSFFLATVEKDQPRVRPFGVVEIYENKMYFLTGKKKNVSKQIHDNSKVEICAIQGEKWLRLSGRLVSDDRVETKKYFLDKNPHLRSMYDEKDDNTEVLYIEDATAVFQSFVEDERIIKF